MHSNEAPTLYEMCVFLYILISDVENRAPPLAVEERQVAWFITTFGKSERSDFSTLASKLLCSFLLDGGI